MKTHYLNWLKSTPKYCIRLTLVFFLISIPLLAQMETDSLLTYQDVNKVMQQIFSQHVSQKQMNPNIIKGAFKVYIDKFDPDRIYLLESEVHPYLNISDKESNAILQNYYKNDFSDFEKLNRTLQGAITRSRTFRAELEKTPAPLFTIKIVDNSDQDEEWNDPDLKKPFAKDEKELKQRIKMYLAEFINAEKRRFGTASIMEHQPQTLTIFEKNLRENENSYLYQDQNGSSISKEEQENLFVMHLLKAFASSLDAHTTFYDGSEAYSLKIKLEKEFPGVGIVFKQQVNGNVIVHDMTENGPAAQSGKVKINDIVVAIDGKNISGIAFDKVLDMIRGKEGTYLLLTLKHENAPLPVQVTLKRQEITITEDRVDVAYEKFDNGIIGIITLHSFYQGDKGITSENDVRSALTQLKKIGNLRGLILDLRENSGGFLGQAIKVAGLFTSNGVIVVSKYFNGEEHFYRDLDGKTFYDGPLIILTSRATASAAEIVAQALQDYGVALVVGDESTYGKGTIQNQTVTDKGTNRSPLFKVTVGKYYTVSGKTPQIDGVKADIIVPGIFNYEHIGERYLEHTVSNDFIDNSFEDNLEDISTPQLKAWFLRYYMPTLQHKKDMWQGMIPHLKSSSQDRLTRNGDYQKFLEEMRAGRPTTFFIKDKNGKFKPIDFQLNEAIAISKDMVQLETQERNKAIAGPHLPKREQ